MSTEELTRTSNPNIKVITDDGGGRNCITVDNRWMDTGVRDSEFPCLYRAIEEIATLQQRNAAYENLISECTDCGEVDSRLFNSYMENYTLREVK